jgi:hypothetical protein
VASFGGLPFVAASMRAFRDVADSFAWLMFRAYIPADDKAEHIQSDRAQKGKWRNGPSRHFINHILHPYRAN